MIYKPGRSCAPFPKALDVLPRGGLRLRILGKETNLRDAIGQFPAELLATLVLRPSIRPSRSCSRARCRMFWGVFRIGAIREVKSIIMAQLLIYIPGFGLLFDLNPFTCRWRNSGPC
jgi:hypothetical protein